MGRPKIEDNRPWDLIPLADKVERAERIVTVLSNLSGHQVDKHFDMGQWAEKTDCGTVGCAAGQCAMDPWFQRRGFGVIFEKRSNRDGSDPFYMWEWTGLDPQLFFGSDLYHGVFTCNDLIVKFAKSSQDLVVRTPRDSRRRVVAKVRRYVRLLKRQASDAEMDAFRDGAVA